MRYGDIRITQIVSLLNVYNIMSDSITSIALTSDSVAYGKYVCFCGRRLNNLCIVINFRRANVVH